jgi:hypothetical protein
VTGGELYWFFNGVGVGFLFVAATALVALWFVRKGKQ